MEHRKRDNASGELSTPNVLPAMRVCTPKVPNKFAPPNPTPLIETAQTNVAIQLLQRIQTNLIFLVRLRPSANFPSTSALVVSSNKIFHDDAYEILRA